MVPTAGPIKKEIARIYFAPRDSTNKSYIGYFDINLATLEIHFVATHPILAPGNLGSFDDNGVLPSSVIDINGRDYMYYIGFKPGGTTRMDLFGGLAWF